MFSVVNALCLETASTNATANEAIRIWKDRPNVVNRRLCGCSEIWTLGRKEILGSKKIGHDNEGVARTIIDKLIRDYPHFSVEDANKLCNVLRLLFEENKTNFSVSKGLNENYGKHDDDDDIASQEFVAKPKSPSQTVKDPLNMKLEHVVLRKLLPRSLHKFKITVEIIATKENLNSEKLSCKTTWFIPVYTLEGNKIASKNLTSFTYGIRYSQLSERTGRFELLVTDAFQSGSIPSGTLCANLEWLKETLLPKLKSWAETFQIEGIQSNEEKLHSLSLVDIEEYTRVYNEMKTKYAQPLIESWQENTDPQKFVFEDISIASYLIVLWEKERKDTKSEKKQTFVDLGCGNGLLVYLLSSEGYRGQGIDIRRRKIWDSYGENTKLLEQPLHPNSCKFDDDIDWIIGNHSDELTPWIPVITARSSYKTKYFLLPCCFHDFTGKFTKNCHDSSQYQTYLEYVIKIGEECGFVVEQDIQRIPSTKRTCHIARKRTYSETDQTMIDERIQRFLESKSCRLSLDDNSKEIQSPKSMLATELATCEDGSKFLPREAKEKVRNCTQIDQNIRNTIVNKVVTMLLKTESAVCGERGTVTSRGFPIETWNAGGRLSIQEVTSLVDKEHLQKLKSQCGGLQTLLKNHGHIFQVIKGKVMLRNYKNQQESNTKKKRTGLQAKQGNKYKTRLCWFHFNHPQGCVLHDKNCHFAHSEAELNSVDNGC